MEIKLIDNPVKLAEFLNNPANTGNIVDSGDKYYIKPDAVYLGIYEGLVLAGVHEVRNFWHSVVECHAVYDPGFRGEYALQGHRLFCKWLLENSPFLNSITMVPDTTKYGRAIIRLLGATLAAGARLAASSPEAMQSWLQNNAKALARVGVDPNNVAQMYQQNPSGFGEFVDHLGMAALGPIDYFNVQDKMVGREIDRGRLAETIRSNQAGEALTARGQNITMRGQDLSASTARRGQDLAMQRASTRGTAGNDERTVQLSDGRTVTVGGKLHGAGANAFYEGIDNEGNMVRVPAGSIAAPATSAASAQNYAMKKDLDAISGASIDDLGFMTGITGSSGSPALGADIRSRASGGDQRKLYNAAQRIQGKMQNQGIAAARDMGASGINTVAEAKMYFQGMPQVDFSSPEALQQSMRDIQQYTDNYNQQYNVNVGNGGKKSSMQQPPTQQSAGGSYTSKSGIQFTVE
ncbi:DUF2824 family protein [Escherichia coli]|nr:DUF2824 family protein [Escherichia coli]